MKKAPVLNNRDFKIRLKFFGPANYRTNPSCLAGYFTWPQVALTHHVCHRCLYAPRAAPVKHDIRGIAVAEGFLSINMPNGEGLNSLEEAAKKDHPNENLSSQK
jgi:hypothetical protein